MNKTLRSLLTAVLLLALVPGVALAGNHQHEPAGVQVDIPDSWATDDDENGLGTVAPDESVAIVFLILEVDTLEAAIEGLDEALEQMFDDVELEEAEEIQVNGLDGLSVSGTASMAEESVELTVALLDTDSVDNILMVIGIAQDVVNEEVQQQTAGILLSIRPILETMVHAGAGVAFEVPFDWDSEIDGAVLTCGPDDSLQMMFWVVEADSLEDALEAIDDELDEAFDDWAADDGEEAEEFTVNGLAGIALDGEALYNGEEIDLGVALIITPNGKVLLIAGVAARGEWEGHADIVGAMLESIRGSGD